MGVRFAMSAAATRNTAQMAAISFMPACQPMFLRTGFRTMVSSSCASGAPAKAMPHMVPYFAPTYHWRQEMVELTHSMPVPMPANRP